MHNSRNNKHVVWMLIAALLIFVIVITGEIQIHNVVCFTHNFYMTPNEALIQFRKEDAEQIGVDENTPFYVLKVDDFNAIVCFVCESGVSVQLMYTKNEGYHNLGWGSFYSFDNGNNESNNDTSSITFIKEKLLQKSGFYSGEFEYAIVQRVVDERDGQLLLSFPVGTDTWTIIARVNDTRG